VPHASAEGMITAAVRLDTLPDQFFLDVVETLLVAGRDQNWGTVHPVTHDGILAAVTHVEEYELGEIEILVPTGSSGQEPLFAAMGEFDYPQRPCSWLPGDMAVVVPKDRGFVGSVYRVTGKDIVGLVHNAARGIAIVTDREVPAPDEAEDGVAK